VDEITASAEGLALLNVSPFQSSLLSKHYCTLLGFDVPSCMILFKSRSQFVYALPIPKPAPRITGQLLPKTDFQN
jgi:hypothetical protein